MSETLEEAASIIICNIPLCFAPKSKRKRLLAAIKRHRFKKNLMWLDAKETVIRLLSGEREKIIEIVSKYADSDHSIFDEIHRLP